MNKRHYEHTLPNIRGSLSNTYFLPACKTGTSPLAIECSWRTTRHFLQALTSFCAGKVVFFRVRPRIMIGLETVLRVFEIS